MVENSLARVVIARYPGCLQSAVYGLAEMFQMASDLCGASGSISKIACAELDLQNITLQENRTVEEGITALVLPPALSMEFCLDPPQRVMDFLRRLHQRGTILCSACAGAFLLGRAGLLDRRPVTTHWALADLFREHFPLGILDSDRILINDNDLITAGGLMSWIDLGLELVSVFAGQSVMRQLGKRLVIDTALRQQCCYRVFNPPLDHGDREVLSLQRMMAQQYTRALSVAEMAESCGLSSRTLLRRFQRATGLAPLEYLQKLRIQKSCDLLESTNEKIETVCNMVGYEDISSFRRTFQKILGITPGAFRSRFM